MVLQCSTSGQFSGVLELIGSSNESLRLKTKRERVLVVVHKTWSKHFAVVYPYWGVDSSRRAICTINLNQTKIERSPFNPEREFCLRPAREGVSFLFRTIDALDKCRVEKLSAEQWIALLSNAEPELNDKPMLMKSKSLDFNLSVLNEDSEEEE